MLLVGAEFISRPTELSKAEPCNCLKEQKDQHYLEGPSVAQFIIEKATQEGCTELGEPEGDDHTANGLTRELSPELCLPNLHEEGFSFVVLDDESRCT